MNKEEAEKAVMKHGSIRKAALAMGVCRETIRIAFNRGGQTLRSGIPAGKMIGSTKDGYTKESDIPAKRQNLVSENELLAEIDPQTRVENALMSELKKIGKAQYMRDSDLRRECHAMMDPGLWRSVRVEKKFWPYAMVVGRNTNPMIYWGRADCVASLIERGKARRPTWVKEYRLED